MKLIVITTPQFFEGEAAAVTSLFQNGKYSTCASRELRQRRWGIFFNNYRWNICRALSRMSNSSWHPFSVWKEFIWTDAIHRYRPDIRDMSVALVTLLKKCWNINQIVTMCSSAPFMTVYPKKASLLLTPAIPCRRRSKLVLSTQRWWHWVASPWNIFRK